MDFKIFLNHLEPIPSATQALIEESFLEIKKVAGVFQKINLRLSKEGNIYKAAFELKSHNESLTGEFSCSCLDNAVESAKSDLLNKILLGFVSSSAS